MRIYRFFNRHPLLIAGLLPVLIMSCYFIGRGVYPFGNSSLLTVDMGQQYIDFFSYFRQTIFGHPGQLFYGFNKDLGGDMYGVFAYYLLSPFNFIFCLFPKSLLDVAVAVITLAKYGAASAALAYWLRRHGWQGLWLAGFGTTYALSGWMLANQLNLMWYDAAIVLPLIAAGVDILIKEGKPWAFIGWLFAGIFTNYYMGYMLCIFITGYFGYAVIRDWTNWHQAWRSLWRFSLGAILSAAMTAVILLPTLFQITQSKGTYTVTKMHWRFEYDPVKLLGKFFFGTFNFDQMPSGQPNLFVGSLVTLGVLLYFVCRKIPWQERLFAGVWTTFLALSMMLEPLDLFWHGMQFPVWYPYRFSFVVVFWLLVLAARSLAEYRQGISWWELLLGLTFYLGVAGYIWLHLKRFPFLNETLLASTVVFALFALMLLAIRDDTRRFMPTLFAFFLVFEGATNATLTLNQISYISHSDYHTYTEALRAGVTRVQHSDSGTYRIGKTILRTKNDAMQVDYLGTDQFNSMFEPAVPQLFGQLGQPAGDGFVAYTAGTLITDAFLDLKYWLNPLPDRSQPRPFMPQVSSRPDLLRYGQSDATKDLAIYKNPYALGLGFAASNQILKTKLLSGTPVINQELLLSGLTGSNFSPLFHQEPLTAPTLKGAKWSGNFVKKAGHKAATVSYTFTAQTTEPYYLQIPASYTDNVVSLTQNGQPVPIYDTFRDPLLLNITPSQPHQKQTLTFTLKKDAADFGQLYLYRLNQAAVTAKLTQLRQTPWQITKRGDRHLQGTITIEKKNQVLMTTIPAAKGWQVMVDNQPIKAKKALDLFIAVPLSRGQHHIKLTYTPPYLWLGLAISLLALTLTLIWWLLTPTGRHTR